MRRWSATTLSLAVCAVVVVVAGWQRVAAAPCEPGAQTPVAGAATPTPTGCVAAAAGTDVPTPATVTVVAQLASGTATPGLSMTASPTPPVTPTPTPTTAPPPPPVLRVTNSSPTATLAPPTSTPSPTPSPPPTPTPRPTSSPTPRPSPIRTLLPASPTIPASAPARAGAPGAVPGLQAAVPPTGGAAVSGNLSVFVPASASGPAGATLLIAPLAAGQPPAGFQLGDGQFLVTLTDTATGQLVAQPAVPLTFVYRATAGEMARATGDVSRVRLASRTAAGWSAVPCLAGTDANLLACSVPRPGAFAVVITPPAGAPLELALPNGRFYKQANGFGGAGDLGFAVTDDRDARFWSEFQRLGGAPRLGWPISARFSHQGFLTQAFQKLVLQWRPELGQAVPVNVLQELSGAQDGWLEQAHRVPLPPDPIVDLGLPWPSLVARHQALLDPYSQLRQFYASDPQALETYGLPLSVETFGSVVAARLQRAVLQLSPGGAVVVLGGGELAGEVGSWPLEALTPKAFAPDVG
jgi:hypothetical protein